MPEQKKSLTLNQFNEQYRINVLVQATMPAELTLNNDTDEDQPVNLTYGSVDDILENINYAVYDRKTGEEVLLTEGDQERYFLDEIYEHFNVITD